MTDTEAVRKQLGNSDRGVIVLGGPGVNSYATYALQPSFPIRFNSANRSMKSFQIKHRTFDQKGTGTCLGPLPANFRRPFPYSITIYESEAPIYMCL